MLQCNLLQTQVIATVGMLNGTLLNVNGQISCECCGYWSEYVDHTTIYYFEQNQMCGSGSSVEAAQPACGVNNEVVSNIP